MANLGCIEINPWHSTYLAPDEPTYIMLDLDPGNISFTEVVNTALMIKEICDKINIPAYCKTSGATGLHIYIPLAAKYSYSDARTFAQLIATIANDRLPTSPVLNVALKNGKTRFTLTTCKTARVKLLPVHTVFIHDCWQLFPPL